MNFTNCPVFGAHYRQTINGFSPPPKNDSQKGDDNTTMKNKLEYIRRVPLFTSLEDEELGFLATLLTSHTFEAGHSIVHANEPGNALSIIVEGQVNVLLQGKNVQPIVINELGPGDFFGEMSLIDGQPRSADVVCVTPVTCLQLNRADFQKTIHRYPTLMSELLKELCLRLRHANDMIKGINISQMYIY